MAHGGLEGLDSLAVGQRIFVKLSDDARWHERLLLAKKSLQEWAVARPTARVIIEDLGALDGVAVVGPRGGLPRALRGQVLLRFDEAELAERAEELRAEGIALVAAAAAIPAHGFRLRGKTPPRQLRVGPLLPVADGAPIRGVPPPAARAEPGVFDDDELWVAAEQRGGLDVGDPLPPSAVLEARHGDRGVARLRSGAIIAIGVSGTVSMPTPRVEKQSVDDMRILPLRYLVGGSRGRVFGETIKDLSETTLPDWQITGPRTTRWLMQAIAAQGYTPLQRHYWWRNVQNLSASDAFVDDHLFISELLETSLSFDQLNIGELASFEAVARRYQLFEEYYGSTLRAAEGGIGADVWLDERKLFLGQDRGRGRALVCPLLEAWVAGKMQEEVAVLKERRRGREERLLAVGIAAAEGGDGGGTADRGGRGRGRGRGGGSRP